MTMIKLHQNENNNEKATGRALKHLLRKLERHHRKLITGLNRHLADPGQVVAALEAIRLCAEIRWEVQEQLYNRKFDQVQSLEYLQATSVSLIEALETQPRVNFAARRSLLNLVGFLISAEEEIDRSGRYDSSKALKIIKVETDLLYQAYHTLFPAERMLVVSGRNSGSRVTLGAVFDVTGSCSLGHVNADPQAMARALIAMDLSNTYLAAWIHSHPGTGPVATLPSTIDQRQHQDWIKDYSSSLVSVIFVSDRWIRFWGTALETGQVKLEISDYGLIKEHTDEELYRLVQ
jgi:hypothetical protein